MGQFESFIGVNFWTALFTLLNTLTIFLVAKKFLIVPVHDMIEKRQQEIDGMYSEAGKAEENAKALESEYQGKLAEARMTSERMVREASQRAQLRSEEIVRQANEQAASIITKATADAAMEKKKAINDAKDEITDMAMAIATKVVGRELSNVDQSSLVDHFIDELGEKA